MAITRIDQISEPVTLIQTSGPVTLIVPTVATGRGGDLLAANNLSDVADASTSRTNLGVAIGADVQAYSVELDTYVANPLTAAELGELQNIDSTTISAAQWGYLGGASAFGGSLIDDADAAAARTTLGLAIGTDVQAFDAGLQSIAGLTTSADQGIYTTGADTYATFSLTAAGRALLDDADAAAQRTTLGATTVGSNLFTLPNPGAITFPRMNADNSVSALNASDFRTAIGAGTGNGDLLASNNLSDLSNLATSRANLGATQLGNSLFTVTSPNAVRFLRTNADNTVSTRTASEFRGDIGAGTSDLDETADENLTGIWTGANARSFTELKNRSITGLTDGSAILLTDANGWRSGAFTWRAGNQSSRITDTPIPIDYASAASDNKLRNPRGKGFTSSTPPTHWSLVAGTNQGYTVSYARAVRNGIPGINVTFTGTASGDAFASSVNLNLETTTFVDALQGQAWTGSVYFAVVSPSIPRQPVLRLFERDGSGTTIDFTAANLTQTATATRADVKRTMASASTGKTSLAIQIPTVASDPGFTIFVAFPSLDQSSVARPIAAPGWFATPAASSATKLIERREHGLLHGEKVRLSGVDYWVERLNSFQYRLHTTLASVYNDASSLTPPSVEAASPSTSVARLKDPGEMRIVAPASDATGASGVWERSCTASTPFMDNLGQVSLQGRTVSESGVNFLWGLTANTDTARAEAVQNAVNAALAEPVIVPPGNWQLNSGTTIQKSNVTLVGFGRNVSTLNYNGSPLPSRGLFFQHPDAGETGQFTWLQNVGTNDLTVWGHTAIDAITYDQAAARSVRFSVAANPFRGVVMRGAQGHFLDNFSVFTGCETPNAACVRAEERPLYGGEDHQPFYPSTIDNSLLGGDITVPVTAVITNITQADPAVVTTNIAHGLQNGWEVWLPDVTGMTEVTLRVYRVANVTSTTFKLTDPYSFDDVDSTGFGTFAGGWRIVRIRRCDYLFSCNRSDGINMSGVYWGSCRRAFVHLDPAREGGGQTPGVFLLQMDNFYFDGIDFSGTTYRSPLHILHMRNTGGSVVRTTDIRFSNGIFANNRSRGSKALIKADANSIGNINFSNVTFSNCNEELIDAQGGTWQFDDSCHFATGGLGIGGANFTPMMKWNGAATILLNGSVGASASTQPRVMLTGTISRLQSSAAFVGTNPDFDVSGATITEAVVNGPSSATNPFQSLGRRGTLTPTLVFETPPTPGNGPTYTTQNGHWQRIGNFVIGRARIVLSARGDGSGGVDMRLGFSLPEAAETTPCNISISPAGSNVLDKGVVAAITGTTRDIRLSRPNSTGNANQRLVRDDLANDSAINVSFFYRVA
jgi:hypothetical protein